MFDSIKRDIQQSFRSGNMITRLILVNCFVFLFVILLRIFGYDWQAQSTGWLYDTVVNENLALSSSLKEVLFHPWTLITHMFLHEGAWHLFWNMMWLFWIGRIFGDLVGDKKVLPTYLMGGLFGAMTYLIVATIIPTISGSIAMGASAAVSAIILATAVTAPDYSLRFILIGNVKLKYVALAVIVLDLLYLTASNSGGHFAHLGGAFFGWLSVTSLRRGYSLTEPIEKLMDRKKKVKKNKAMHVAHKSKLVDKKPIKKNNSIQLSVDTILDKIKAEGIESLSKEEKEILDKASQSESN